MLTENHPELRKEIQLIICLGRKNIDDSAVAQAQDLLKSDMDWDFLLAAVVFHGVFPPFFKHLKLHFSDLVPAKCFRMMTGHNEKIRYLNLGLVGTFLKFHALLEKNNISSVMFKGPALAVNLYDDLLLREYSDVDVLVSRSDVRAAQAILLDSGYSATPQRDPPLSRQFFQSDVFFEFECEHTFSKEVPISVIDLHWQIQPAHILPLDFEKVMEHTTPLILERRLIQTVEPNLSIVVLAAHASRHWWRRLVWLRDIAEMIDQQSALNLDWEAVKRLSDGLDVTPMVVLALNLAQRIYGCQIPDFAKSEITDTLMKLLDRVYTDLEVLSDDVGQKLKAWKFCIHLLSSWRAKVRYLATEIFHPTVADYVRFRLPLSLYKAYYLLHPLWLVEYALRRRVRTLCERRDAVKLSFAKIE